MPATRRRTLEAAKGELRRLYGRERPAQRTTRQGATRAAQRKRRRARRASKSGINRQDGIGIAEELRNTAKKRKWINKRDNQLPPPPSCYARPEPLETRRSCYARPEPLETRAPESRILQSHMFLLPHRDFRWSRSFAAPCLTFPGRSFAQRGRRTVRASRTAGDSRTRLRHAS